MRVRILSLCTALTLGGLGCSQGSPQGKPQETQKVAGAFGAAAPSVIYTSSLTKEERRDFYHLPEGGELLPLDWLRAVESVRTFKPFMEDLGRFRLLPDPEDPDGLPVGMSATLIDGKRTDPRMVFFNCAACHTTEVTYHGKTLRVEGAPSHFDMAGLIGELLQSFDSTLANPQKLAAFMKRLPAPRATTAQNSVQMAMEVTKLLSSKVTYLQRLRGLRPTTPSGYGRLDAFIAARNLLFGDKYAMDVNSPVSLPPIFGISRLRWFHYDNNTNSFLQRNIGEDLGVGAVADAKSGESTVQVRNLLRLEAISAKLLIPKWPEDIFGKLDQARVARGAVLYKKECASCHEVGKDGKVPDQVISLAEIGTDPNRSTNFARPIDDKPFSAALAGVLDTVEKKAAAREKLTPAELAQTEPAQVVFRTTPGYSSRAIDGVWATAPYLHNGSVPTLYDLLLPPDKRPKTFHAGSREFDPQKVGYSQDGSTGATFLFDTTLDANHNSGHLYGTTLAEADRLDLLEYLKSR